MKLVWSQDAWDDYLFWQASDPIILKRINELIRDTKRAPFNGVGKPEPLKGAVQGWRSRRITSEHRLVYRVSDSGEAQALEIAQCRFHY